MTNRDSVMNWDDEWAELLAALCADDAGRVGTVGDHEGELAPVRPTRFGWLYGFDWWPAGAGTGLAMLELAEPGTMPAEAWEPLCGPLREAPVTPDGHLLVGRHKPAGSPRQATLTLVTDQSADGVRANVLTVRISVEPV
ncbi:hypothetical protein [Paractinoplanes globisporus]|uniref:Uncharacterized protein n=1 Tax=Paractinoplanes globisporus TaxID=113565 RepID=A0ABW6W903_9ACTN|nr:hypothetical protein [Actinoplanes globisporus]